jgi:hypothetical protein
MSEKEFVDGLYVKSPHHNAPDFVIATLSINRKMLGNWLRKRTEDHLTIDLKNAKNGNWYAELNNFVAEKTEGSIRFPKTYDELQKQSVEDWIKDYEESGDK